MRPDETLVNQALAGDLRAFEALVDRHRDVVFRVAARIVGTDEAEDVAQDSFLRAFHRLSQFRGRSTFRTWLLRITHNASLDALAKRRATPIDQPDEEAADRGSDDWPQRTPADALEVSERRARLSQKLQLMRPPHRAVLVLRDLEGLSYEQIATVTEAPLGSVKGRLHRARQELIEILRANTYDWELPRADDPN
jgi:RNA polymerase sigma-70 factor, ECF subfamily